jgi:hypothetical protein
VVGLRTRHEPFVLYAVVYGGRYRLDDPRRDQRRRAIGFVVLISMIAAIAGLIFLHARFKELKK